MQYDAIICGAGPAGLSAAITLANAGAKVVVIEKGTFPREKTCAGILTDKTITFLKENISTLDIKQFYSTNKVTLFYENEISIPLQVDSPFVLVNRKKFDSELFNICKRFLINIIQNQKIISIYPEKNMVVLDNGQTISYNYLIAADGVHSKMRTLLKIPETSSAFCLQYYLDQTTCFNHLDQILLYFGHIPFGYSWVVPTYEFIIVGTGAFTKYYNVTELQKSHDNLCTRLSVGTILKKRGAYVPIGGIISQADYPYENIVFVGDAAGLANPITGEGIYHALLSGLLAGKSYINAPQKIKATYYESMQDTINNLHEQENMLYQFYNDSMLKNVFFQLHEYPKYLSSICDEVISQEHKSYYSLLMELESLFR